MSKSHPQQWSIREQIDRPDARLIEELRTFPTTQIADCGGPVSVVGPGIGHCAGGVEICAPAVTVWTKPGDILFLLKTPDLVREGDVLVVDGGGRGDAAIVGDILGATLDGLGCRGIVVDGVIRDLDGLDEVGIPAYARGAYPTTASVQGPGAINHPIQCGGVVVNPGDVVRADRNGVVVVPREHLADVIELTRIVDRREADWRADVAAGATLPEATGVDALIATSRDNAPTAAP